MKLKKKQKNKWLKAISVALSCVLLATSAPVGVWADEVTDKVEMDIEVSNPVGSVEIAEEDHEVIWSYKGSDTIYGTETSIINADSGVYVNKENSMITEWGTETGTALGCVYEVCLYGMNFSRDDKDVLVIDEFEPLGGTKLWYITEKDLLEYPDLELYQIDGMSYYGSYGIGFSEYSLSNESLGSQIVDSIQNYEMPEYDMYSVFYYYLSEDGEARWTSIDFLMEGKETVLKFVDDTETPEDTGTPDAPAVSDSYEAALPADDTSISADDFANILEENKTKDVVITLDNGVSFTFAQGTMSAVDGMESYDFGADVVSDFANTGDMDSSVTVDNFVLRINYNYSGDLPAEASIKIYVGTDYANQTLYYSQILDNGFKYIQSVVVDAEGYITVTQDHCSDYVVTTNQLGTEDDTTQPDNTTQPDDTTPPDDTTQPDDTTSPGGTTQPNDTTPPDDTTQPGDTTQSSDNNTPSDTPASPKTGDSTLLFALLLTLACGFGLVVLGLKRKSFVK